MKKRPESVLVVLHCDGHILMLKRVGADGFWQSVTGSLECDESPRQAAVREVAEETGICLPGAQLADLRLCNRFVIPERWRNRFEGGATHNEEHVFSAHLRTPAPPTLRPDEHDQWRWMAGRDALTHAWSWTNRDAIRLVLASSPAD